MFDFTPEDGTGLEDANAYIDLAYARAYHEARGQLATWNGTAVTKAITAADATANTITIVDHGFVTGDGPVRLTGDDLPAPLAVDTDYYVVVASSNTLKVAATYADAIAESPTTINLTDAGTGDQALVAYDFDAQRQAIIRATDYIEEVWAARFKGCQASATQGLAWPRSQAWEMAGGVAALLTGVPEMVKRAAAEYALRALSRALAADSDAAVTAESMSADGISRSWTYASPTSSSGVGAYPVADRWLRTVIDPARAVRY